MRFKTKVKKKSNTEKKVSSPQIDSNDFLVTIPRPSYTDIVFPDDISKISSRELGNLLGKYTGLQAYALAELAKVRQRLIEVEYDLTRYRALYVIQQGTGTKERWRLDHSFDANAFADKLRKQKAQSRMLEAQIDGKVQIFEKYVAALSRELTRRSTEVRTTYRS